MTLQLAAVGCATGSEELTVFVAASLSEVAEDVSGADVRISPAGSNELVAQIIEGAPADVLITADADTMQRAVEAAVVDEPVVIARNRPALVVPAGNPAGVTGIDDLEGAILVICAPPVPCGAAAAELAELASVQLSPASEYPSVTDVLGAVSAGQADAGIVYASDVVRAGGAVEEITVAEAAEVHTEVMAAVVEGTGHQSRAEEWIRRLLTEEGQRALSAAGFQLP